MKGEALFRHEVASWGLHHFSPDELVRVHDRKRGEVRNDLPPMDALARMRKVVMLVDSIRDMLGAPIVLLSLYRSPAYNRAVGGAPKSFHMTGQACDFAVAGKFPTYDLFSPVKLAPWLRERRDSGQITLWGGVVWRGGVGQYPGFVHVDTREAPADWEM